MRDCSKQMKYASEVWDKVFSSNVYQFSSLVPSELPEKAGVYVIWLKNTEEVLYVGRTRNIRQRLYTNHLMGNKLSARLKKYLVDDNINYPEIVEYSEAKDFIKKNCCVQFLLVEDNNDRGHIEGLLGFLTDARYIEAEH